jgi:hypothetical protein
VQFGVRDLPPTGGDPRVGSFKRDFAFDHQVSDSDAATATSVGDGLYYWDCYDENTPGGKFIPAGESSSYKIFGLKLADFTGPETGYDIDWIRTFESVEAMNAFKTTHPRKTE